MTQSRPAPHAAPALASEQQELKVEFGQLVRAFGGQDAAAAATGYAQSRFSNWKDRARAEFPPLHVIAHLEGCTVGHSGHPHVTRLLARRAGFALVPLSQSTAGPEGAIRSLAHVQAELGDVSRALLDALSDGDFSPADGLQVLAEIAQLEDRIAALRAGVEKGMR